MSESKTRIRTPASDLSVPLVVQVGFAGSRKLVDTSHMSESEQLAFNLSAFETELQNQLADLINQLKARLGLERGNCFLCGISQVAAGADIVFTRVCKEAQIPHRVFLPQHSDEFLSAIGTD